MKLNLDLSSVSTMSARVVVPTGNYNVKVVSAEAKETKSGGGMLVVGFSIQDGEHKGVVINEYYNIVNKNEDTVRIALSAIKTMMTVGGHRNPEKLADSDELLGLSMTLYVEEEETTFTGRDGDEIETTQNRVKGYMELQEESEEEEEPAPVKKKAPAKKKTPAKKKVEEPEEEAVEEDQPKFPWQK